MEKNQIQRRVAYFVTSHGFGHASRACAVMQSILEKDPTVRFEVFTHTPEWFFRNSIYNETGYHYLDTDVCMVQKTPFQENIKATLHELGRNLPFEPEIVESAAAALKNLKCKIVLCDIAPMGIAVAGAADIPSVLIENFTWDWIYSGYQSKSQQFKPYIEYLRDHFNNATYHIKTKPYCQQGNPDLIVAPVSRKPRSRVKDVRARLGLRNEEKLVILTMGGVKDKRDYATGLEMLGDINFIIPGVDNKLRKHKNVTYLPSRSDYFHPDLIMAADVVIGKAGYSTIAEVYNAGKPFGYINRPTFRESSVLVNFIQDHMDGLPISDNELVNGSWYNKIYQLLTMPTNNKQRENGADEISKFVLEELLS